MERDNNLSTKKRENAGSKIPVNEAINVVRVTIMNIGNVPFNL